MDINVREIFCIDNATFLLTTDDRLFFSGVLTGFSKEESINSFKEIESMRGIKIEKIIKSPNSYDCLLFILTASGEVFMWGTDKFNLAGRESLLQDKNVINKPVINRDLSGKQVIDMHSDNYNIYFQTQDDRMFTYDFFTYYYGEKVNENHTFQEIKIPKISIRKMIYIDQHSFIVTADGELYQCRKCGSYSSKRPVIFDEIKKLDLKGLHIISIGENFNHVLLSDGNIYSISINEYNGFLSLIGPKKAVSCFNDSEIITSLDHDRTAFFLTKEGKIYGTGSNEVGQLGIGTTFNSSICLIEKLADEMVSSLQFVSRKNKGNYDSLYAITADGNLYVWGSNYNSCLGLGTIQKIYKKPTLVNSFDNNPVAKIIINGWSNFYIMRNGHIYVSGDNTAGQLGISDFSSRTKPTLLRGFEYTIDTGESTDLNIKERIIADGKDILKHYRRLLSLIKTNPEYTDSIRKIGIEIARLASELPTENNSELIQALLSLGYSKKVALLASSMVDSEKRINEQILDALCLIDKSKVLE